LYSGVGATLMMLGFRVSHYNEKGIKLHIIHSYTSVHILLFLDAEVSCKLFQLNKKILVTIDNLFVLGHWE